MDSARTLDDRRRHVLALDEANRLLPFVRTYAARINRRSALRRRLESELLVLEVIGDVAPQTRDDFHEFVDKNVRYHRLGGQVDALAERLATVGAVVRDRDASWVDFTCLRRDGLAVFCWRKGEERISHWHLMHEPHAKRRRLPRAER
jgi:hypothetical protein